MFITINAVFALLSLMVLFTMWIIEFMKYLRTDYSLEYGKTHKIKPNYIVPVPGIGTYQHFIYGEYV